MFVKLKADRHIFYRKFNNWEDILNYIFKNMSTYTEDYLGKLTDKYYFRLSQKEREAVERKEGSITNCLIKAAI